MSLNMNKSMNKRMNDRIGMNNGMLRAALFTTAFAAALATAQTALAEPAIYADGEMMIPQGAVFTGNNNVYYSNIRLSANPDGSLSLTGAEQNPLVTIEELALDFSQTLPPQVILSVSGYLSTPCVELLPPAISYNENEITVLLAETRLGPAETCIAVTEPFTTDIPLAIDESSGETYSIDVNGASAGFTAP